MCVCVCVSVRACAYIYIVYIFLCIYIYVVPNHVKPTEVTFSTFHTQVFWINILEDDLVTDWNMYRTKEVVFILKNCVYVFSFLIYLFNKFTVSSTTPRSQIHFWVSLKHGRYFSRQKISFMYRTPDCAFTLYRPCKARFYLSVV
jgi:hypothetical protein